MTTEAGFGPLSDDGDIAAPWRRFFGFVIDWTALVMISLAVVSMVGIDLGGSDALRLPASARFIQGAIGALYYVGFTIVRGQTPGKILMGTRVVMQSTAQIPGLGPAAMRWLIPGFFVFLPGVSVLSVVIYGWLLFDVLRRGLHDKAAKTVVIHIHTS